MSSFRSSLVWFRRDLRLSDNLALNAALRRGAPIVPVFVHDDAGEGTWELRGPGRRWLELSLAALEASLREHGSRLVVLEGDAPEMLRRVAVSVGADAVFWNKRYEPHAVARDSVVQKRLADSGITTRAFEGALLFEPDAIRNRQAKPFQVFTPFWRHCMSLPIATPERLPTQAFPAPANWPDFASPAESAAPASAGVRFALGEPGERGAASRLRAFLKAGLDAYADARDVPSQDGTSRLSAHLCFGEITPRQIWSAVAARSRSTGVFPPSEGAAVFLKELGWREFAYHVLANFPHTAERPLRPAFERFPWADDPAGTRWRAWTDGRTGYPIVDAGMRQLLHTGWMHNRVRMIVASFLVKHLRLPWTRGAAWFWEHLADADVANNTFGWQWSAGCGADAAPYFRIFAPVAQGEKFDAEGEYVRTWVPELVRLPKGFLHAPWTAPAKILAESGVRLGKDYPLPIVDHARARADALAAFRVMGR